MVDDVITYGARNYNPFNVVLSRGQGEWVWDIQGKKYLDMLSAYSAVNQGHCHPKLLKALELQARKLCITSRAYHNECLGPWMRKLATLTLMDKILPMNSGAEAVETSIKLARKWAYSRKGILNPNAKIIVCNNNFHGRTTTIVSFSSEPQYRDAFAPYDNGFVSIPFGDAQALEKAITQDTAAFLVEPVQGEAGIILPPEGYLKNVADICKKNNVLCIFDEIQTGLGRTGKMFAHEYENTKPDLLILGKALGGGIFPISAVAGRQEIMDVFQPGDHGSTFGGNPLACAISIAALDIIIEENLVQKSFTLGEKFREDLRNVLPSHIVKEVRGKGLLNGIEIYPEAGSGRFYGELLCQKGVLSKDTHGQILRFAPPLMLEPSSLDFGLSIIKDVFSKTEDEWKKGS